MLLGLPSSPNISPYVVVGLLAHIPTLFRACALPVGLALHALTHSSCCLLLPHFINSRSSRCAASSASTESVCISLQPQRLQLSALCAYTML